MNKILIVKFSASLLLIILMSVGILYTKMDLPFAIAFLIPIVYFSVQKNVKVLPLMALSAITSVIWLITSVTEENLSLVLVINSLLRFGIYFSISYLLMLLNKQRDELAERNKQLSALNQEKNILLGTAAHDLRNAASAIYSFSTLLLNKIKDKDNLKSEIKITTIINQASNNLLNMVTNILDLSKIESGQIHLKKVGANYNKFIQERIDLLSILAQNKDIKILFHKSEDLLTLTFDLLYLTEVIDNLISNAIKYSNPGSEIIVVVKTLGKYVRTDVIDKGIGINSSELDLLFKPFSKTSSRPTGDESSSGLGLAIAQKVVKLHGGEIGVESLIHEGSTFFFLLPL